jgi:hypothetical protein
MMNIQWTQDCFVTLTTAVKTACSRFDATNRRPRDRKLTEFQDTDLVMHMRRVIRTVVQQTYLCFS